MIQIATPMLKNIFIDFQDNLHQQILRFQQRSNFHQKLKKLHIKKSLLSQMLYLIIKHNQILILLIQLLFLVVKDQFTKQDLKVFNYLSQQFHDSVKLKELVLLKAMKIFE
ncbi:unnamed protein product [Paramecium pentaurelia]|uniref:Transmembrane protein n=1 Tax=Paramecium pentaurelia TaxID=43138 RepID=A0A8S1V5V6_9CILI|nr:unnamed protein product [Paramecium pentaurelia]